MQKSVILGFLSYGCLMVIVWLSYGEGAFGYKIAKTEPFH